MPFGKIEIEIQNPTNFAGGQFRGLGPVESEYAISILSRAKVPGPTNGICNTYYARLMREKKTPQ